MCSAMLAALPIDLLNPASSTSTMMNDLFDGETTRPEKMMIGEGAILLRGKALALENDLLPTLDSIAALSPFRHMVTPGGFVMSVATTSCGKAGWVADRTGYRYTRVDPETGRPWPAMPPGLRDLAAAIALEAGHAAFEPDACLINVYEPGARLSLHQDRNERDFTQPIVSLSFGLPAAFQFGGLRRDAPVRKFTLMHGDAVVWGGPSRLCFHGVAPLKDSDHPLIGRRRINLTFRKAL